jgi:hypothetical protein
MLTNADKIRGINKRTALVKQYFHVMIDIYDKETQKDVVQIISTMCLDSLFVSFTPSPGKGLYTPIPCDLFLFSLSPEAKYSIAEYRRKHRQAYPDASYIYFGRKFYFYDKTEILEIPKSNYIKYLTRCLLNQYLEFNKKKITEELKQIKDWDLKK